VTQEINRCRLSLIATSDHLEEWGADGARFLQDALQGGDVAFLTLAQQKLDETTFLNLARPLVEVAQSMGVAVIVDGDTRVAGRIGADGLQLGQDIDALRDAIDRFAPKMMVGVANVRTRHNALSLGECEPDYVMFGKPGGDTHPQPHSKNLGLGEWWAAMVEIPGIVLGGTDIESVVDVAKCGTDFVALSNAIFAPESGGKTGKDAAARIAQANQLLENHAPLFETDEN